MGKYVNVRIPREVYEQWKLKKVAIEQDIEKVYGQSVRIPITNLFRAGANVGGININQTDLIKLTKRRWKNVG